MKSEGDNGDLSFHSTVSRATRLYEDSTLWATETKRHRALKDEPTDANTADIEAAHHMNPPPDKGIQSTGDIRHHKRVWQQADEVTSLPGALDLFLWENKPNAKGIPVLLTSVMCALTTSCRYVDVGNSKNTFGSIIPTQHVGSQAHSRLSYEKLRESFIVSSSWCIVNRKGC